MNVLFIFLLILCGSGCSAANRAAKGLKAGQANLNYMTSLGGALRVGITDYLEGRVLFYGLQTSVDLFIHTNNDSSFNYGVTLGYQQNAKAYAGLTVGFPKSDYYSPYFTYTAFNREYYEYEIAMGLEIKAYKSKTSNFEFLIIPEINKSPWMASDPFHMNIGGTIGIGITF